MPVIDRASPAIVLNPVSESSRVALLVTTVPAALEPRALAFCTSIMPALMVVRPEYVLAPERVKVLVLNLLRDPPPLIIPEIAMLPVAAPCTLMALPLLFRVPLMVNTWFAWLSIVKLSLLREMGTLTVCAALPALLRTPKMTVPPAPAVSSWMLPAPLMV